MKELHRALASRERKRKKLSERVEEELSKAKYTKRTGGPGHYKYTYGQEKGRKPTEAEAQKNLEEGRGTKEHQARQAKYIAFKEKVKARRAKTTRPETKAERKVVSRIKAAERGVSSGLSAKVKQLRNELKKYEKDPKGLPSNILGNLKQLMEKDKATDNSKWLEGFVGSEEKGKAIYGEMKKRGIIKGGEKTGGSISPQALKEDYNQFFEDKALRKQFDSEKGRKLTDEEWKRESIRMVKDMRKEDRGEEGPEKKKETNFASLPIGVKTFYQKASTDTKGVIKKALKQGWKGEGVNFKPKMSIYERDSQIRGAIGDFLRKQGHYKNKEVIIEE